MELEMTKTSKIVIGALISVVTLGGLVSYASPGSHFGKFGGMNEKKAAFIIERISSKLDLNDLQKQNLVALKDVLKAKRENHQQDNQREELKNLLSAPVLDETKVLAMVEAKALKIQQVAPTIVSAIANFTNSLNAEQRSEMISMADNFKKHRGGRFSGRHFGNAE